jgi:hypothetical protein
MPTTNPRISVTLSPTSDSLVARMAKLQRVSKSQVLRELLEAAEPALHRVVTLMTAASEAAAGLRRGLQSDLEEGGAVAQGHLASMMSHMDEMTADLVSRAEAVQGRRPRRPTDAERRARAGAVSKPADPPSSNRGVKTAKQAKTGRGKRQVLRAV